MWSGNANDATTGGSNAGQTWCWASAEMRCGWRYACSNLGSASTSFLQFVQFVLLDVHRWHIVAGRSVGNRETKRKTSLTNLLKVFYTHPLTHTHKLLIVPRALLYSLHSEKLSQKKSSRKNRKNRSKRAQVKTSTSQAAHSYTTTPPPSPSESVVRKCCHSGHFDGI